MRPQDLNNRTDEELLEELESLEWHDKPSPWIATATIWILPVIILTIIFIVLFAVDVKVDKPEYQQSVEFEQFLEVIKDEPFIITIDGKKYTVTIGEANGN